MRACGTVLLATIAALPIACTLSGSGHAERVDVPISIEMTIVGKPDGACHGAHCNVHYRMTVIDQGTQGVNLLDCTAAGLDADGAQLFETGFSTGAPAGGYTAPGQPYRGSGTLPVNISPKRAASLASLSATCGTFVWHGQAPI